MSCFRNSNNECPHIFLFYHTIHPPSTSTSTSFAGETALYQSRSTASLDTLATNAPPFRVSSNNSRHGAASSFGQGPNYTSGSQVTSPSTGSAGPLYKLVPEPFSIGRISQVDSGSPHSANSNSGGSPRTSYSFHVKQLEGGNRTRSHRPSRLRDGSNSNHGGTAYSAAVAAAAAVGLPTGADVPAGHGHVRTGPTGDLEPWKARDRGHEPSIHGCARGDALPVHLLSLSL